MAIVFNNSFDSNQVPIKEGSNRTAGEFERLEWPNQAGPQSKYFRYPNAGWLELYLPESDYSTGYNDGRRLEVVTFRGNSPSYSTEKWFHFVYRFPPNSNVPFKSIIWQLHGDNVGSPPITMNINNGSIGYKIAHSSNNTGNLVTQQNSNGTGVPAGPLFVVPAGGATVTFTMVIKQSQGSDGYVGIWVNGVKKVDYKGKCGYNSQVFGYPKYGFYPDYNSMTSGSVLKMEIGVIREGVGSSYNEITGGGSTPVDPLTVSVGGFNEGQEFVSGSSITLTASVNQAVDYVEWYDDGALIQRTGSRDTTSPYGFTATYSQVRSHTITAKAVKGSQSATSAPRTYNMVSTSSPVADEVTVINPTPGEVVVADSPETWQIQVKSAKTVSAVEFYIDGNKSSKVPVLNGSYYEASVTLGVEGPRSTYAIARFSDGSFKQSPTVNFSVEPGPTTPPINANVVIKRPTPGQVLQRNTNYLFLVELTTSKTLDWCRFYVDGVEIESSPARLAPLDYPISFSSAGSKTAYAKAEYTDGTSERSADVNFSVA